MNTNTINIAIKNTLAFLALILLTIGIPSCTGSCPDVNLYFDIQNVTANNYKIVNTFKDEPMGNNDSIEFEDYLLRVNYDVTLYSKAEFQLPFSTNALYALSCAKEGEGGSVEGLESVSLITQTDYDGFSAGDTINSQIKIGDFNLYGTNFITVEEFVSTQKDKVYGKEGFVIKLTNKPQDLNTAYSFKLVVKLGNGEEYTSTTQNVFFK